nr:Tx-400 [Heteropoda pingtungensis]
MSLYHTLLLSALVSAVALVVLVEAFGRNEVRCRVICSNRDSEECKICNNRIPMRFGKRSLVGHNAYLYDLAEFGKPEVRLLALVPDRGDSDDSYSDEK